MSGELQSRYPGVQPFRQDQQHLFFGRKEDTARLYAHVAGEKLTILFGRSGYGKSSLIQAGLFPALTTSESNNDRRQYLPLTIRFNNYSGSNENLFSQYYFHQQKALQQYRIKSKTGMPALPDTLWGRWKAQALPDSSVLVLAFDQFEEFFSYPLDQQQVFKQQLAELLYSKYPPFLEEQEDKLSVEQYTHLSRPLEVRALFAIRSDRLSELNGLQDYLPAILHKRIELGSLSLPQAKEAIIGPALFGHTDSEKKWLAERGLHFQSPNFEYQENTLRQLLSNLGQPLPSGGAGVEAFLLQVLCNEIENRVINGDIADVDGNDLPDVQPQNLPDIKKVFTQYYERRLNPFSSKEQAVAKRVIEEGLIQLNDLGEGRRLSVDGGALLNTYGQEGLTEQMLDQLVDTFLLRREPNSLGGLNYELSHDTLLDPVVEARRQREANEAQRQKDQELATEKSKRQQATRLAIAGFVLAGIAISAGLFANQQSKIAEEAKQEALVQADSARAAQVRANDALKKVNEALDVALQREREVVELQLQAPMESIRRLKGRYPRAYYQDQIDAIKELLDTYGENPYLRQAFTEARNLIE